MVGVVLGRQRRFTWWWWWCLVIIFVRLRASLGLNMCTCIFTYCPYLNHRGKILVAPSHNTPTHVHPTHKLRWHLHGRPCRSMMMIMTMLVTR